MWFPYLRLRSTMTLPMLPYHVNQCSAKLCKTITLLDIIEKGRNRKNETKQKKKVKKTSFTPILVLPTSNKCLRKFRTSIIF